MEPTGFARASVLVAVDQPLLRSALVHVLARHPRLDASSCAPDEVPELCAGTAPDVVVASRDVATQALVVIVRIDGADCWLRFGDGRWLPRVYPGISRLGSMIVDELAGLRGIAG